MFRTASLILASAIALAAVAVFAQDKPKRAKHATAAATEIGAAGPDFAIQGEYQGTEGSGDKTIPCGVQVIALGAGKFHAVEFPGGLPGVGWNEKDRCESNGTSKDGTTSFEVDQNTTINIHDGAMTVNNAKGETLGTLKKTCRTSPTLGAKPPAGAIVLFDGRSADAFIDGRVKDGVLLEGTTSKQKFQSYTIHLEFMIPFMPTARGQGRGNSGYYSQGRYETQILDSFGLVPQKNDCAAIYGIKAPRINMCYPPLSWQTYDVDYTAAVYQGNKKVKNALLTVRHNGVEVQKNTEATHATTAAPVREGPEPGPIYLQNHGNPVRFRNIWLVEKK